MCGISGFIGKEIIDRENILKEMMEVMRHRGPDSEGTYFSEEAALGFCRLSIIDLQAVSYTHLAFEDAKLAFDTVIKDAENVVKGIIRLKE